MIIDFHVHYYPKEMHKDPQAFLTRHKMEVLLEIMPKEVWQNVLKPFDFYSEYMEKYGIDKAVIFGMSNTPEGCKEMNNAVCRVTEGHPDRFIGFGYIPLSNPEEALEEFDRVVKDLGFKGIKIYQRIHGLRYDSPRLRPIFEKACELNVPVLMHSTQLIDADRPDAQNPALLLRSGLLEDFPGLKLVLAHMGGGLVYFKDFYYSVNQYNQNKDKSYSSLFKNLYFDTSPPNWGKAMIRAAVEIVGDSNLLFGTDYPYTTARALSNILESNMPEESKKRILGGNAARLLNI